MRRQKITSIFLAMALVTSVFALPTVTVLRKSPEFAIADSSGRTMQLSSFKGKVVVMEFLFVKSQHCMRVAATLNKLNRELGPSGFQAVGIVFDPPNTAEKRSAAFAGCGGLPEAHLSSGLCVRRMTWTTIWAATAMKF